MVNGRITGRLRVAALVAATAWVLPGATVGQSVDCDNPDLGAVLTDVIAAQAAVAGGDRDAMLEAVEAAAVKLDAIMEACGGTAPTVPPEPSMPAVDLPRTATLTTFTVNYPDSIAPIEQQLLRSVRGDPGAEAITLADSEATGDLIQGALEAALPETMRVVSVAMGAPAATLATIGAFDEDDPAPASGVDALEELAASLAEQTSGASTVISAADVVAIDFPDGTSGASMDIRWTEDGAVLAQGRFLVRELDGDRWALAVAVGAPVTMETLGDEAAAIVASVTPR